MRKEYIFILILVLTVIFAHEMQPLDVDRNEIIGDKQINLHLSENNPYGIIEFGSDPFVPKGIKYVCEKNSDYEYPKPQEQCWQTEINFQSKRNYVMNIGDELQLNPYLRLRFTGDGNLECDPETSKCALDNWDAHYTMWFTDKDFFEAAVVEQETLYELGNTGYVEIQIRNTLAERLEGGLYYYEDLDLVQHEYEMKEVPMTFEKGTRIYRIPVQMDSLGSRKIKLRPFFEVNGIRFVDNRSTTIVLKTVPEIGETDTSVDCTNSECPDGFYCQEYNRFNKTYHICEKGEAPEYVRKDESTEHVDVSDSIVIDESSSDNDQESEDEGSDFLFYGIIGALTLVTILLIKKRRRY